MKHFELTNVTKGLVCLLYSSSSSSFFIFHIYLYLYYIFKSSHPVLCSLIWILGLQSQTMGNMWLTIWLNYWLEGRKNKLERKKERKKNGKVVDWKHEIWK